MRVLGLLDADTHLLELVFVVLHLGFELVDFLVLDPEFILPRVGVRRMVRVEGPTLYC